MTAPSITVFGADDDQQYLAKNPLGYRCHANTGIRFPEPA
jgi:peptide-methionine (S)-S-oxide reductase